MDYRALQHMPPEYRDALNSDTYTPPEFLINPDHPDADEYLFGIAHLKRSLMATTSKMKPRDVGIVKAWHQGHRTADIAERAKCHPHTVLKVVKQPMAQKLYQLLQQLSAAIDGPNEAERRAMLWRIARIAETRAPKTAITAISELNRMTLSDYQRNTTESSHQPTVVIMNQTVIPRGALDQ